MSEVTKLSFIVTKNTQGNNKTNGQHILPLEKKIILGQFGFPFYNTIRSGLEKKIKEYQYSIKTKQKN